MKHVAELQADTKILENIVLLRILGTVPCMCNHQNGCTSNPDRAPTHLSQTFYFKRKIDMTVRWSLGSLTPLLYVYVLSECCHAYATVYQNTHGSGFQSWLPMFHSICNVETQLVLAAQLHCNVQTL